MSGLVTVRLVGIPVALHREVAERAATLQREIALVRAGKQADAGDRLRDLSAELDERFGGFTAAQRAELEQAPEEGTIDLAYEVPPEVADAAEQLGGLLDEVDELCRSGELVTLATPPEHVAYRRWFLGEFVEQARHGRAPLPWSGAAKAATGAAPGPAGADAGPPLMAPGDLDLLGSPALRAAIAERLESGATSIVVDLARCVFIDSVGLSLLLTTRERCQALGGTLTVVGAHDNALRLFETVGVKDLLISP